MRLKANAFFDFFLFILFSFCITCGVEEHKSGAVFQQLNAPHSYKKTGSCVLVEGAELKIPL